MSKGGTQTTTQNVDPRTQQYVDLARQYALSAAGIPNTYGAAPQGVNRNSFGVPQGGQPQAGAPFAMPGLPPEIAAAQAQYGQYANAGNLGLGALTGGPNPFMNTYLSGLDPQWAQLRQQTLGAIGDQATQAGAFGGSRQGVAQGVALGELGNAQAQQQYQAFNDAQQRALQAANLGFGAIGAGAFLPQMYHQGQLGLLQQGLGPYGQTQSTPTQGGGLGGLLGGALTLASIIPGPWQGPAVAANAARSAG